MSDLKSLISSRWNKVLTSLDEKKLKDIYVWSFFVYDDEDDHRLPTVTFGYNLKSNLDEEEGDEEEKWNYAYWPQNNLGGIGDSEDKEGRALIQSWIKELGLEYKFADEMEGELSEAELAEFDDDACYDKGAIITEKFIALLIEVVKETHSKKLTDLPILIHELEYYDDIRDQNILANGKERVKEFSAWIDSMY